MTQDKTRPGANDYGYSFDRDPRNRRVTRYRYNSIPVDQPGRYVYLRDQEPCVSVLKAMLQVSSSGRFGPAGRANMISWARPL
ncbi:MAG TPA: hypothetical protein VFC12_04000 [Terriglobales bacterium]|nr:hypothetical protein [Terriglobales bacterium]